MSLSESSETDINVLEAAKAACSTAQEAGGNQIYLYHNQDVVLSLRRDEIEWISRINHALDNDLFCLYVQPIVSLASHEEIHTTHYELLIRMCGEDDEIISPNFFLPVAERYNLSLKLDKWVITHALNWLVKNPVHVKELAHCAINLSGKSIGNEDLLQYIKQLFKKTAIPPEKICFEVTETAAVANISSATKFIDSLQEIGCRFALDDFGSGLSSFGYFQTLPVDYLKIDGIFVKLLESDKFNQAIVKSINEIGNAAGKKTIAEFVENNGILIKLREIGVDFGQGYHFSKPIPLEEFQPNKKT